MQSTAWWIHFQENYQQFVHFLPGQWRQMGYPLSAPKRLKKEENSIERSLLEIHRYSTSILCQISRSKMPPKTGTKIYVWLYPVLKGRLDLNRLLDLGTSIEGRHHSGIDDCHTIANVVTKLIEAGNHMFCEALVLDILILTLQAAISNSWQSKFPEIMIPSLILPLVILGSGTQRKIYHWCLRFQSLFIIIAGKSYQRSSVWTWNCPQCLQNALPWTRFFWLL